MINVYEGYFREALSQRTLLAASFALTTYYSIQILLLLSGGRMAWLEGQFYIVWFPYALPLLIVLLLRLRHLIQPHISHGKHLVRGENLLSALIWISCSLIFVHGYFSTFAPAYLQRFIYPEGRWGPPVLREQPFYLISFGVWFGLMAYISLAWNVVPPRSSDWDSIRSAWHFLQKKMELAIPRIIRLVTYSLGALILECFFMAPPSAIFYSSLMGYFYPLRRMVHSFRDFVDPTLWMHLVWVGVTLGLLFLTVDWIIEWLFSGCFHICRRVPDPTTAILAGLRSTHELVRDQATLELSHLMEEEPEWRRSLFEQFIKCLPRDEMLVSRMLMLYFIERLQTFKQHLILLNVDLGLFGQRMEKAITPLSSQNDFGKSKLGKNESAFIFSPRKRNFLEKFLLEDDHHINPSKTIEKLTFAPSSSAVGSSGREVSKSIPEVLAIGLSTTTDFEHKSVNSGPVTTTDISKKESKISLSTKFTNAYLHWTLIIFAPWARTFPGRVYAAWACEVIKGWWLGNEPQTLIRLLDALSTLVTASLEEDIHGQVQFILNDLIKTLLEVEEVLREFLRRPIIRGQKMLDDLFGPENMSPTERKGQELLEAIVGTLELIVEAFAGCWRELNLAPEVREKLQSFVVPVAETASSHVGSSHHILDQTSKLIDEQGAPAITTQSPVPNQPTALDGTNNNNINNASKWNPLLSP